jgi:hypothetical protein
MARSDPFGDSLAMIARGGGDPLPAVDRGSGESDVERNPCARDLGGRVLLVAIG